MPKSLAPAAPACVNDATDEGDNGIAE